MFYTKLAWFSINTKKWISSMVLFSLAFAYLLPIILLTGIPKGFEQLQTEQLKDMERVLCYSKTGTDYKKNLGNLIQSEAGQEEVEAISCVFSVYVDVILGNTLKKCNVNAIDETYDSFYDWQVTLLEGQQFIADGEEKVCVLGEELYQQCLMEQEQPAKIIVNGTVYRIVGTTNREEIYVPYQSLKEGSSGRSYVYFKLEEGKENLTKVFSSLAGYYAERESERQEVIASAILNNVKTVGTILTVLFFIVVLNLIAIWREQYMQLRSMLGIQRAVGMCRSGLFLEQVIQSFLLSVGAIAIVYLFSPVLNRLFAGFGEIRFSFFGLGIMLAAAGILALIQASIVTILIYRCPVRTMLDSVP